MTAARGTGPRRRTGRAAAAGAEGGAGPGSLALGALVLGALVLGALVLGAPVPADAVAAPVARAAARPPAAAAGRCVSSTTPATGAGWPLRVTGAERAWSVSRGAGQTVAVLAGGVGPRVPAGRLGGLLPLVDTTRTPRPATVDCAGLGTAMASVLTGRAPDGTLTGVAPDVRVLPVRVLDSTATGTAVPGTPAAQAASLAAGIGAAVRGGADVVAVGRSLDADPGGVVCAAARAAVTAGVVVVAPRAPGGTPDASGPVRTTYPAACPGTLPVDSIGDPAGDGSGSGTSRVAGVTAVAARLAGPGVGVPATVAGGGTVTLDDPATAVAWVAGVAALVRAAQPRWSPATVTDRLETTAEHQPGVYDPDVGWGLVDPYRAVAADPRQTAPPQTAVPRAERAGRAAAPVVAVPPDTRTRDRALRVATLAAALTTACAVGAALFRRRRPVA